jgi:ubiquinone/menaquinone biosynthesis C-methylase UbiE
MAKPFEDASFDLVLATMVLSELSRQRLRAALHECRRVLREGGRPSVKHNASPVMKGLDAKLDDRGEHWCLCVLVRG